jgi:predicted TIM-barrel fold metal-dependent hydrolase
MGSEGEAMATAPETQSRPAAEVPLEPDLPICDPHHHLRERPNDRYFLEEFIQDTRSGHNIVATVCVENRAMYRKDGPETMKPIGETEFFDSVAAQAASDPNNSTRVAAAIVGHADLSLGEAVAQVLEAHLRASPNRFRGIRHSTTWDESETIRSDARPGSLADKAFRRGFACLQRYGLSFDAWLYHPQLSELVELARAFPDVTIVLDHIGGPLGVGPYRGKRDEVFQVWSKGVADLSTCPNVAVKLGGFGSTRSGYDWHERAVQPASAELANTMAPYFDFGIEHFGVHRCMFESNFPVDKASYSYVAIWNAFKRISQGYSAAERNALFHDTAASVYTIAITGERKQAG